MSEHLKKALSLFTAIAINSVFCSASFAVNPIDVTASNKSNGWASNTQTVVVKAKRLSLQQKADYDKEQINSNMQTITISAKRLSAADKLSFDKAQEKQQQANDMNQNSMQKLT